MPGNLNNGAAIAKRRLARFMPEPLALILLLGLALALAGCQSGAETGSKLAEEPRKKTFRLEKGSKVLVAPFECDILGGNYAEAAELVRKTFAGWTLYALQDAGVHADIYVPDARKPRVPAQAGAAAPDAYLPLTPDSRLSRTASGGLTATPLHDGQWERSDFAGELTAGELSGREFADDNVVSSGTVLLSPPSEARSGVSATRLGAEDAPLVAQEQADESGAEEAREESRRERILRKAAEDGYDYVLLGNVVFLHSEVKPIQNAGKRSATTVRGEFASTYRLLAAEDGEIMASGAITGKAGKYLSLGSGVYNDSTINNAVSRVINQTMSVTAKNTATRLMNPSARFHDGVLDGMESDEEYYRDSPGKMRRN